MYPVPKPGVAGYSWRTAEYWLPCLSLSYQATYTAWVSAVLLNPIFPDRRPGFAFWDSLGEERRGYRYAKLLWIGGIEPIAVANPDGGTYVTFQYDPVFMLGLADKFLQFDLNTCTCPAMFWGRYISYNPCAKKKNEPAVVP